mgnify:FL=1
MIRLISLLTMAAVIALLLGVHPFAVYLLGLLVTLIILWEGKK